MSVVMAVAVKPREGMKPYILMGSDSKKVNAIISEEGNEVFEVNEEAKKIYRINNTLIGMAGRFSYTLMNDFIDYLSENDGEIEVLCKLSVKYLKHYFKNQDIEFDSRCTAIIAQCENSVPAIARVEVDVKFSRYRYEVRKVEDYNAVPVYIGQSKLEDLQEEFEKRIRDNNPNLNISAMKKAAEHYLKKAAARYPDTCNQNIVWERL